MPEYEASAADINSAFDSLDLDSVDETTNDEFEPLEDGWYFVKISDFKVKKGEKAPYILWYFKVITIAKVGSSGKDFRGRMAFGMTSLSKEDYPRRLLKQMITSAGVEIEKSRNFSEQLPEFIGARMAIKVAHEKYNNEMRQKVRAFAPIPDDDPIHQKYDEFESGYEELGEDTDFNFGATVQANGKEMF